MDVQYQTLLENLPVAIAVTRGPDLIIDSINDAMLKFARVSNNRDVVGKTLLEVLPELQGQAVIRIVQQVQRTGQTFRDKEFPIDLLINGSIQHCFFDLSYTPIIHNAEVTSVIHAAIDVTEQVKKRHEIAASEQRFRIMADAIGEIIWVTDKYGMAEFMNKRWEEYTGLPFKPSAAGDVAMAVVHPDDRDRLMSAFSESLATGKPLQVEQRNLSAKDEYRWFLNRAYPYRNPSTGEIEKWFGTSIDINESVLSREAIRESGIKLYNALEQVRLSKDAAELGTFDLDLINNELHWDDRCRTLFGISHQSRVSYEEDFVGGLHPKDRDRILRVIANAMVRSVSDGDYDVEYRTVGAEDGRVRWVKAKGKVYFDDTDKPMRFIGSVLDVTEKNLAVEEIEALVEKRTQQLAAANRNLVSSNNELQRSNASLEEFVYAASHDLKEPIRKITVFTNQLKTQMTSSLTTKDAHAINRIEHASLRMSNLIDDLLLYSHVSQRPHDLDLVNLNEKVRQAMLDLDLDIEEKKAKIEIGNLPTIRGYRRQLQQMFQNLIGNALKYSKPETPPVVSITSKPATVDEINYHLIEISDNGIGFEQEFESKIFRMFSRLHTADAYAGTGVGLAIVKKVVENHDGLIRVKSQPGIGTTFQIFIPEMRQDQS